jgi:hypothetical protein
VLRSRVNWLVAVLTVGVAAVLGWKYWHITRPVSGLTCPSSTIAVATAAGLNFNHTASTMRDPVNGILVTAAVGQPVMSCRLVFSTFRCEGNGPATVRVKAGSLISYYETPAGQRAIVWGRADGDVFCTLIPNPGAAS